MNNYILLYKTRTIQDYYLTKQDKTRLFRAYKNVQDDTTVDFTGQNRTRNDHTKQYRTK